MKHGIGVLAFGEPSCKILLIQCLCGRRFYPTQASDFETFNAHVQNPAQNEHVGRIGSEGEQKGNDDGNKNV